MTIAVATQGPAATNGSAPAPGLAAGQAGDWMVALFASREATDGTVSLSAGWDERVNNLGGGGLIAAWTRPWESGDVAPTYSLTGHATGASGDSAMGVILRVRPTTGFELSFVGVSTPSHNAASTTTVGPIDGDSLAVDADGVVLVLGHFRETSGGHTTLSGDGLTWAQVVAASNTAGADNSLFVDWALSNNVAISDKSFTLSSGGGSATGAGFMLFLKETAIAVASRIPTVIMAPRIPT